MEQRLRNAISTEWWGVASLPIFQTTKTPIETLQSIKNQIAFSLLSSLKDEKVK